MWPDQANGVPADLKYRFNWTMPLALSPHDRNTVYVGSQHVHRTTNGGQSWEVISPDLSTNDKSRQQFSGGLTGDNIGVEYAAVVMAIAESPRVKGLIWAGTNDGQVQLTRDDGKTWTNVTKNIPDCRRWGTVANIEPSRYEAGVAYLTVDLHQVEQPRSVRLQDGRLRRRRGRPITNGIPKSMLSYAHCIREDPVRRGLLYLGTENAIYVSFDDGGNWQPLQMNLPHAPVYWITVQEHFNDLVIATYGRGFWILDDITPLQQLTPSVVGDGCASVHAAASLPLARHHGALQHAERSDHRPESARRRVDRLLPQGGGGRPGHDQDRRTGRSGATHDRCAEARRDQPVYWDLRDEPTPEVQLRTSPLYAPDVPLGPNGWRSARRADVDTRAARPLHGQADSRRQGAHRVARGPQGSELGRERGRRSPSRRRCCAICEATSSGRPTRSTARKASAVSCRALARTVKDTEILKLAAEVERKFTELEMNLVELRATGRGQDGVRWGAKLYSKLNYLANGLASSDYRPTAQQLEVHKGLKQQIEQQEAAIADLASRDVTRLNQILRTNNVSPVTVAAARRSRDWAPVPTEHSFHGRVTLVLLAFVPARTHILSLLPRKYRRRLTWQLRSDRSPKAIPR